jgi:hypothetical protein
MFNIRAQEPRFPAVFRPTARFNVPRLRRKSGHSVEYRTTPHVIRSLKCTTPLEPRRVLA